MKEEAGASAGSGGQQKERAALRSEQPVACVEIGKAGNPFALSTPRHLCNTFVTPSQWRGSGMMAWNRESVTPATFCVQLKYSDA